MSVDFRDNSSAVKSKMAQNVKRALTAMGMEGVSLTLDVMNTKYGRPIWLTGDLQRSIAYSIDAGNQSVAIGSNLDYAKRVHEGTASMTSRPFIRDGVLENVDALQDLAETHLKQGF